jgi:RNA polymerase sigma-70 factor (ECF subfamily)
MMNVMVPSSSETFRWVERAVEGDQRAWAALLDAYQGRLERMVSLRIDPRLRGRIDASDVIQEAYVDAFRRLAEYRDNPEVPFYVWLRLLVVQKVMEHHRRHLGAQGRDAAREVSLHIGPMSRASTDAIAERLIGRLTSPTQAAVRAERKQRLREALDTMDPIDREIIVLRNHEQLTNGEAALILGLDKSAASKRYFRAVVRLKEILVTSGPGGSGGGR